MLNLLFYKRPQISAFVCWLFSKSVICYLYKQMYPSNEQERERFIMKATLEFILLTQSPALFLAALVLLIGFFIQKKNHRVRAALSMIGLIVCVAGGIVLYYFGMKLGHFTIDDFWKIRVPGWVGLGLVVALTVLKIYRTSARAIAKRRADKFAAKAEAERLQELENAKNAAYESGKADALAAEKVVETVVEAAEEAPVAEIPAAADGETAAESK